MADDLRTKDAASGARPMGAAPDDGADTGAVAPGHAPTRPLALGLLAAPGLAEELARDLARDLPQLLRERLAGQVAWVVPVVADDLAADARTGATGMIDAARRRMLDEGWDLAVCLTDLPLRIRRRPVVADASATHGVALVSLPALGAVQLRRRASDAVVRLVDGLLGEATAGNGAAAAGRRRRRITGRLAELASPARAVRSDDDDDVDVGEATVVDVEVGTGLLVLVELDVEVEVETEVVVGLVVVEEEVLELEDELDVDGFVVLVVEVDDDVDDDELDDDEA